MVSSDNEPIQRTEELRRRVTQLALGVENDEASIGFHTTGGRARLQLAAVPLVDPETVRICVKIGPDELRRHLSEISNLIRGRDMQFGIVIKGRLRAILRKHPDYQPKATARYIAQDRINRGMTNDLSHRIEETLSEHEARLRRLEKAANK